MSDAESRIIYVVDDEPAVPEFIGRMLLADDTSYHVECFDSARSVLARMAEREPGVLVTDIQMPETDGMELLRMCRETFPDVEVILVTAHASMPTALEAFSNEAFAYLEKPFKPDALKLSVRRAFSKRRLLRLARGVAEKQEDGLPIRDTAGAGSFFAASWEYLPQPAIVLDSAMRVVAANRQARSRFRLGRRIRPLVKDVQPLSSLVKLAALYEQPGDQTTLPELTIDGAQVHAVWAEFLDGVRFCVVSFAA